MILAAVLHIVLPVVIAGALVLLVIGRRGRLFLRILLLGERTRPRLSPRLRRVRLWSAVAVAIGALCAMRAAEAAASSVPQTWLVWTMAALTAVLALGGCAGLLVTGRRRAAIERGAERRVPEA